MYILAVIVAAILAILGVFSLLSGEIIRGIILIILAFLIGPGGYSILGRR